MARTGRIASQGPLESLIAVTPRAATPTSAQWVARRSEYPGRGLKDMKRLIESVGGRMKPTTAPGLGTTIAFHVAFDPEWVAE